MSINWVMLNQDGGIIPMPNERILYTSRPRIGLDISTPRQFRLTEPFAVKSDSGLAYITNQRVIYLPARPTEQFRSFAAPIFSWDDTHVQSSMFGPWSWGGVVKPVTGGGVPMHVPRVEVRLSFKEGGYSDFQTVFERLKERLNSARDLGLATGQPNVPDEDLPPYQADAPAGASQRPSAPRGDGARVPTSASTSVPTSAPTSVPAPAQATQPAPDEPPPDYVEAQTAALSNQYEERVREEAATGEDEEA